MKEEESLLTPAEVAAMFRVATETVRRWANAGKLDSVRNPGGGHYRFRESEVRALLAGTTEGRTVQPAVRRKKAA